MQYYTKQQIQGATRFHPRVLIGNWNEDRQVQECVLQDFVERKEAGNLHIHKCVPCILLCASKDVHVRSEWRTILPGPPYEFLCVAFKHEWRLHWRPWS